MSESVVVCPKCTKEFPLSAKFCTGCGAKNESLSLSAVPEAAVANLKNYLANMIAAGDDPLDDFKAICEDFATLGLPEEFTFNVIQEFSDNQAKTVSKIKLYYDSASAQKGVAQGATGLELKIENISSSGIASVGVSITHPEDLTRIDLEKILSLGKGKSREVVKNLRFSMVGQHFINGEVVISLLNGSIEVYRFASPIRLSTENSNVSRHTHMSQTITTNGGGIVSESGMGGMAQSPQGASKGWELVRLVAVNLDNHSKAPQKKSDEVAETIALDVLPVAEPANESIPIAPTIVSELVLDSAPQKEVSQSDGRIELGEPFSLPIGYESEGEDNLFSYQRILIEEYLPQQLLQCALSQITPRVSIYRAVDINFALLKTLSKVETSPGKYLKMSDIYALAVKGPAVEGIELEAFDGKATALTLHGFFVYTSTNNEISLESAYDWFDIKDANWELSRQIFGPGSEIISLGSSSDDPLPNLTFDLRKSNAKVDVSKLGQMIHSTFRDILSLEKAIEVYYPNEELGETGEILSEQESQESFDEEILDDDIESSIYLEEDGLTIAARSFFAMFAFVTQFCNESYDRPIHVYIEEEDGGDVGSDLAEEIQALFPSSKLIAICEEDPVSCHDENGRLLSWSGMACAITRDGVFHVNSSNHGNYELAGKNSFLSWQKLFGDLKVDLIIRDDVPDMWIGTQDTIFIKGVYIDYSNNINEWIYFNEFVRKEFLDRLMVFKDAI